MKGGIYAIRHVSSGKLYIGSSVDVPRRFVCHRSDLRRGDHRNSHLQNAWKKHGASAFVFEVLQAVENDGDLIRLEQEYIDYFKTCQRNLGYNIAPKAGSTLGKKHSAKTRVKLSALATGRRHSLEARAKMSADRTGRSHSPETKAKMAIASTGRTHSAETRAKLSAASSGKTPSAETRAKLSESLKNRVLSAEHRAKIAEAARKRDSPSLETRAKLSASLKGKVPSLEARAKLSAAAKGRPLHPNAIAAAIEANRRRTISPEHQAKMLAARVGKEMKMTSEVRAKISEAQKERWRKVREARQKAAGG